MDKIAPIEALGNAIGARRKSQTGISIQTPFGACWKVALIAAVALAFALKVAIALNTYGSNDVITWERHLAKIKDVGGAAWYRDGTEIPGRDGSHLGVQSANHPPLVIHVLLAWDYLARLTGLPFRFWLRFFSSLADIGSLVLVFSCLTRAGMRVHPKAMLLVALSPASIMISGFHGNTDPVMIFFVLLSIWVVQCEGAAWVAGAALGIALSIKIVPVLLMPVFLLYLPSPRRRTEFMVGVAAVFVGGSMPYIAQHPVLLMQRVFGYSSTAAAWGVSQMSFVFLPKQAYEIYMVVGKAIALLIILLASFWMNWGSRRLPLFLQCGGLVFLFLFVTPGFAVQYLAWLVPWCFSLSSKRGLFYYASSSAYLFGCYTWWSGGFPWFLANSFERSASFGWGILVFSLGLMCWISVGAVAHETLRPLSLCKTR